MIADPERQKSFEDRIQKCPIHQWINIGDYLGRADVPPHLWIPFHELVLARGEFPKVMSMDQGRQFGERAVDVTLRYEIRGVEAESLIIIFGQLIEQWRAQGVRRN